MCKIKYSDFTDDGDRHVRNFMGYFIMKYTIEELFNNASQQQIHSEISKLHDLTKAAIDQLKQWKFIFLIIIAKVHDLS